MNLWLVVSVFAGVSQTSSRPSAPDRVPVPVAQAPAASSTQAAEPASVRDLRRLRAPRSHRPGQWLLDFIPVGYANSLNLQSGFNAGMTASYMAARFAWIGGAIDWMRVGFGQTDSVPPIYHHSNTWRILARTGLGWGERRVWAFWTASFGFAQIAERVSNYETIESVWPSGGLSVATGAQLFVAVHPNLSLGLAGNVGWDISLWGESYDGPLFWFTATPVFRVHL